MALIKSSSLRPREPRAVTEMVRKGLAWEEAESVAADLGLPLEQFAELTGISRSTFFRRRNGHFTPAESDHIMRFAHLWGKACAVFEDEDGARAWLKDPALGLNGEIPLRTAMTEAGAREVDELLTRIDYGVLS